MFIPNVYRLNKGSIYFNQILQNLNSCFTGLQLKKINFIHIFTNIEKINQNYYINDNTLLIITIENYNVNKDFLKLENKIILMDDKWNSDKSQNKISLSSIFSKKCCINDFNIINSYDKNTCIYSINDNYADIIFDKDKIIDNKYIYIKNQFIGI